MAYEKYSQEALFDFFEYLKLKGLVKPNSVRNWKNAAIQVLEVLQPDELQDLRNIDTEDVFHRFTNLKSTKYAPKSLQTYKTRFDNGINSFLDWVDNPSGFKPNLQTRKSRVKKKITSNNNRQKNNFDIPPPRHPSDILAFPIPIRLDCVVNIVNLPSNLTASEAKKIAAVIVALADPE